MIEVRWRRAILGVAFASGLLGLPFLGTLPLFDPDEGYYPAAAAESLAHGHPLDLTLNGEPRWNKPPLAYALMQGGILLFGRSEFAVRLPSVLEGAALVAILGLVVARVAGGKAGLLAAVVLASSLGFQVMARAAHPEMGLVLGTAAAQALFALWFVSQSGTRPRWTWWAAGIAMGFGFLAKGPSAVAMPALMLAAGLLVVPREGRPSWAEAGRAFGGAALLALLLASPWYLWMGARHGDSFWGVAFGQMEHLTDARHGGFRGSPFFFVPVLAAASIPWLLFLPSSLRALRRSDPAPPARFTLLMALAAGTSFLFWSFSASKNPHYALVFLPPLAVVVASFSARVSGWQGLSWQVAGLAVLSVVVFLSMLLPGVSFSVTGGTPPGRCFARRIREQEGASSAAVAIYRRRLPSMSFYTDREVSWPHAPEALDSFLASRGRRFLVIHGRHTSLLRGHARSIVASDPDTGYLLLRLDPPASPPSPSPPPPAPAPAPRGAEPPPAGGPR